MANRSQQHRIPLAHKKSSTPELKITVVPNCKLTEQQTTASSGSREQSAGRIQYQLKEESEDLSKICAEGWTEENKYLVEITGNSDFKLYFGVRFQD